MKKPIKYIFFFVILLMMFSCKNDGNTTEHEPEFEETKQNKESNVGQEASTNNGVQEEAHTNNPLSGMLESMGMDSLNLENNEGLNSLLGNEFASEMIYQMLGKRTIDRNSISEASLDTLKKILKKHPDLKTSGALVITESTVKVDFPKLAENLSKLEDNELKQILAMAPDKSRGSAPEKHPFKNTFIEENLTHFSFYSKSENKQLYKELAYASPEEAKQKLATHYEIKPEEVELLKSLKKQPKINNTKQAQKLLETELNNEVEKALNNPNTSDKFKSLVNKYKTSTKREAKGFVQSTSGAREAFYALNPGWYSEDQSMGNTYVDSRGKAIYLPLGKLSFADAVVSFDPGNGGLNPTGSLKEPDLEKDTGKANPFICNIGLEGVLSLQFTDNAITDVNGPDLYVFEIGAIEPTILELSRDNKKWVEVGKIKGGTAMVDIANFVEKGETFTYIRLTDLNTRSTIPGADVDAVAAIGGAVRLQLDSSVLFEFGKFELKPEAKAVLTNLIPQIEKMGKGTIVVEGHTDDVGSGDANKKLSEQRAESVLKLLKSLMKEQANNFKWQSKGFGESQPLAPNDSEENRQKNRRVELLVLPY